MNYTIIFIIIGIIFLVGISIGIYYYINKKKDIATSTSTSTPIINTPISNVDYSKLFIGDIIGGDVSNSLVSSIDECYNLYLNTTNCSSFVYKPFVVNGNTNFLNTTSNSLMCMLKNSNGIVNPSDTSTIWYKSDSYSNVIAIPYQSNIIFDTSFLLSATADYIGGDSNVLTNITANDCFSNCKYSTNCVTFIYDNQHQNCYLKDGTGKYINSERIPNLQYYGGPIDYGKINNKKLELDTFDYIDLRPGKIEDQNKGIIPSIKTIQKSQSINDCINDCKVDTRCNTIMYGDETCYLLGNNITNIHVDTSKYNMTWVSGNNLYSFLQPQSDIFDYNDTLFKEGDLSGGDIGNIPFIKVNSDIDCYRNCLYVKDCETFVYDKSDNTCTLKDKTATFKAGNKHIYIGNISNSMTYNVYK